MAALVVSACGARTTVPPWHEADALEDAVLSLDGPGGVPPEARLFRSALALSQPRGPVFQPVEAREQLAAFLEHYPRSRSAEVIPYFISLLDEVHRGRSLLERRDEELLHSQAAVESLGARLRALEEAQAEQQREQRAYVERLERELRTREATIQELESTLRELMRIDQRRRP